MPYNRPGPGVYVTNGSSTLAHGQPVVNSNFVGVAVKQKARSWQDGYAVQARIEASEDYFIITKGVVTVPSSGLFRPAKGDAVYIIAATNALQTPSSGGGVPFGRISEVAGERGTPTGKVRVDLDAKDSL